MIKLYDYPASGNCYKIRLFLNILGVAYETVPVDFYPGLEHRNADFKAINPLGQLPVLDDDGFVIRDAQAILAYLASKYDAAGTWFDRDDPVALGKTMMWLAFAGQITATSSAARLHDVLGFDLDVDAARKGAHAAFRILDDHLIEQEFVGEYWLAGDRASIADIACFPYVALAPDGGINLGNYHGIRRWLARIKRMPDFVEMPGIFLEFDEPMAAE